MPFLLNLSLGPVQEFIASARRGQDLWYGSWLLSELSKAAAKALQQPGVTTLIFPGGLAEAATWVQDASVANKVLALVEGDFERARALAQGAQEAMQAHLNALAAPVFDRVYQGLEGKDVEEAKALAWEQIQDLMEFQWVAVPFEAGQYSEARETAERHLNAIKNTKPWTQPAWARAGWRKSSLDGVRESVIPERFYEKTRGETEEERALRLYGQFRVKPAERLCGVGLLKRWGTEPASEGDPRTFHSTSHMAAGPLRARAETLAGDPAVKAAWEAYRSALRRAPFPGRSRGDKLWHPLFEDYDGSVLYPSRLREIFFAGGDARQASGPNAQNCEAAEEALQRLLKALGVSEPTPYYALLLADGDRMGAAIDAQQTVQKHQKISAVLDAFAQGVKSIVEKHKGSLIYSGGDDVLAMLPLHTCLDCAEKLAQDFATKLAPFQTAEGQSPTLSVGLALAHHLEDFADVRAWAKQAEGLAKRKRNSLAIRLEKRGGSPVEACGSWDSAFLKCLRGWIDLHAAGKVPNKLPFQWAELVRLAKGNPAMNELVMAEARRLLARKDQKQAGTKEVKALLDHLAALKEPSELEALSAELLLAKEIERAVAQAGPAAQAKEVA